ncbi:MAG: LysR family transcriptional regulator [Mesorhizobium sp.]|nr:MAG: LysR family transcriptional regulator [Mesorhizobium sp.]
MPCASPLGERAVEISQVRYFLAVARELNFTRAAEQCNVTQPALSRAIKLLEEEFGGTLFHRERRFTHLTELGRMVETYLEGFRELPPGKADRRAICSPKEDAAQGRHHEHDRSG